MSTRFDHYVASTAELTKAADRLMCLRKTVATLAVDLPWSTLTCENGTIGRTGPDGRTNPGMIELAKWPSAATLVEAIEAYQTARRAAGISYNALSGEERQIVKPPQDVV